MRHCRLLIVSVTLVASWMRGEEWPHFLGPHADTTIRETGLRIRFPDSGLPLLWKQPTGGGYSGPSVAGGHVFLMDRIAGEFQPEKAEGNPNFIRADIPGKERVRALDAIDGEVLWVKPGYCPPVLATIHGREQLLVWHGDGVASLDPTDGNVHWFVEIKLLYGMAIGAPRAFENLVHVMGYNGVSAALWRSDVVTTRALFFRVDARTARRKRWRTLNLTR